MAEASRLADLYGTLVDLALEPAPRRTFPADPAAFGAARGLGADDRAALVRFAPRLGVYRQLVQATLADPLEDCFPICRALLRAAGAWDSCVDAFISSRAVRSPYYRDINPAFVQWLADGAWGQDRWPFLLQLAHWEYMELEVLRWPEPPPGTFATEPGLSARVRFDPSARVLAYGWRVHGATEEAPVPAEGPAHLLAFRDLDLEFAWKGLSPPGSAFLVRCQRGEPALAAAAALGLDRAEALDLLEELRRDGAILGFSD